MKKYWEKYSAMPEFWLIILMIPACLARLLFLGNNPMGLHQDEAYSAYNAWAVMNYGIDSFGYVRPVYYIAWGSGMNVLYSWLTMPFLVFGGISAWTIRLPQALLGCACIPIVYGFGIELFGSKWKGLACAALLAINPWHIQQSRTAIETNTAVPMLLTAMYFLCRYLNGKRKSIWGAAIFFGLTLYCYALTWFLIPLILLLHLLFFRKRFSFDFQLLSASLLLIVMATPLILFLAINMGWLPEIRTVLFSIPKLEGMRMNEFSLHTWELKQNLEELSHMLWTQHDERWWDSNAVVGSYYYISIPFILLGFVYHIRTFIVKIIKKEQLPLHFTLALWFGSAFLLGCFIESVRFHKVNYIHIPIILYGGIGIWCVGRLLKSVKITAIASVFLYLSCFIFFIHNYFFYPVDYSAYGQNTISRMNWYHYEKALDTARNLTDGPIYVTALNYANVMLYVQIPPQDFIDTAVYDEYDGFGSDLKSFDRYYFDKNPEQIDSGVIVYTYMQEEMLKAEGFRTIHADECYGVAYK